MNLAIETKSEDRDVCKKVNNESVWVRAVRKTAGRGANISF